MNDDPDIWADLAERFANIEADKNGIVVDWIYFPISGRTLRYLERISEAEVVRVKFSVLVAEAGASIDAHNPSDAWLADICAEGKTEGRKQDKQIEPGGTAHHAVPCMWGQVVNPGEASVILCLKRQRSAIEQRSKKRAIAQPSIGFDEILAATEAASVRVEESSKQQRTDERAGIIGAYFDHFRDSEKIQIMDLCWAAKQRYREWSRWKSGELKDGSKADKAFRAVFASRKRPEEYKNTPRPKGWK